MIRLFLAAMVVATGACGVKGDLVRAPGTEPPEVATSTIKDATTEPDTPQTTLF